MNCRAIHTSGEEEAFSLLVSSPHLLLLVFPNHTSFLPVALLLLACHPFAGCSITTQFLLLTMSLLSLSLSWLFLVCTHGSFSGTRKEGIQYGYRQMPCKPPQKELSLFHECSLAVQDKGNIQQPRMPGHHWAEIIANQYPTSLGALIGFGGSAFQTRSVFCSFQLATQDEGGITITEIVSFQ